MSGNLVRNVIIEHIKEPKNRLSVMQSYIDQLSSEDIKDIMKIFTPDEIVANRDIKERMEVLRHVKEKQETQRKQKSSALSKEEVVNQHQEEEERN